MRNIEFPIVDDLTAGLDLDDEEIEGAAVILDAAWFLALVNNGGGSDDTGGFWECVELLGTAMREGDINDLGFAVRKFRDLPIPNLMDVFRYCNNEKVYQEVQMLIQEFREAHGKIMA